MEEKRNVLSIEHLSISFSRYERGFRRTNLNAIRDLSLTVGEGEMVAVVGASGSGKSLLAHAVLGILPYNASWSGNMTYCGEMLTEKRMKALRGKEIVLVPQSVSYLDPLMRVGEQVRNGKQDRESRKKSLAVLGRYGLDEKTERLFPFQLSGGMTRRILISTAVMETPRLVIADEPTPGLHITAARRVLSHFREIADQGAGVHGGPDCGILRGDEPGGGGFPGFRPGADAAAPLFQGAVSGYAGAWIFGGSGRPAICRGAAGGLSLRAALPVGGGSLPRGGALPGTARGKGEVRAGGMADGAG